MKKLQIRTVRIKCVFETLVFPFYFSLFERSLMQASQLSSKYEQSIVCWGQKCDSLCNSFNFLSSRRTQRGAGSSQLDGVVFMPWGK